MGGDVVGKGVGKTVLFPEGVRGNVDRAEAPGGCPWRRDARDRAPRESLLTVFNVCEGNNNSEEDAVPAVVRDRGEGVGTGGSWHNLGDVIESSAEDSGGKPSRGPRESGVLSTG